MTRCCSPTSPAVTRAGVAAIALRRVRTGRPGRPASVEQLPGVAVVEAPNGEEMLPRLRESLGLDQPGSLRRGRPVVARHRAHLRRRVAAVTVAAPRRRGPLPDRLEAAGGGGGARAGRRDGHGATYRVFLDPDGRPSGMRLRRAY